MVLENNYEKYGFIEYDKNNKMFFMKLKISDIISIHAPLNDETEGLVNEKFLSQMKKGASLVNTARGPIVSSLDIFYDFQDWNCSGTACSIFVPQK